MKDLRKTVNESRCARVLATPIDPTKAALRDVATTISVGLPGGLCGTEALLANRFRNPLLLANSYVPQIGPEVYSEIILGSL